MKTSCIHIDVLERESRLFLLYGAFLGISLFSLMSLVWHYERHVAEPLRERRIVLDLVYLPPPEQQTEAIPEPAPVKPQPQTETEPESAIHIMSDDDSTSSDKAQVTILAQPHAATPGFPLSADSSVAGPTLQIERKTFRFDPFTEYAPVDQEEPEIRDERRDFKHDFLGIRLDGPPDMIINGGRHALKSLKWMVDDVRMDRRIANFKEHMIEEVTEKDVRFLALLWAKGNLDPITMTMKEREFVSEQSSGEIMNNGQYLENMRSRGMVRSLKVHGHIIYEPTVTKDAFIGACFAYAATHPDDPSPVKYLELATSTDSSGDVTNNPSSKIEMDNQ